MQIDLTSHLKTAVGATPPRVQISPLPPTTNGNIRLFCSAKNGTKRFASNAKSEQNAPKIIYTVPNFIYSDLGTVRLSFTGGAA